MPVSQKLLGRVLTHLIERASTAQNISHLRHAVLWSPNIDAGDKPRLLRILKKSQRERDFKASKLTKIIGRNIGMILKNLLP
jgi:hypothetical protein